MSALVLPDAVRDEIVAAAREGAPDEVCGVLGGSFGAERSRVDARYPATNAADDPRSRYRIDPEEQFALFEGLEARGEEIVGFYHSHPRGPPAPSDIDRGAAAWPDRSYVIVSLEPELRVGSWRWRDRGAFEREEIGAAGAADDSS